MCQNQCQAGSVEQHQHHSTHHPIHHQCMRGQSQCPDNLHTPMIQDALLLLHQQLNTLTLTTKWWTTWAGSTGRTPSETTSTLPGLAKLLVHHPILAVVSATPLLQTNIVLPTTLLVTPTLTTMMAAPPQ